MTLVRLQPANMLASALGSSGTRDTRLDGDLAARFDEAHAAVTTRRSAGAMGFYDLPYDRDAATQVQEVADSFGQWFQSFVVVGIGGSSLGARAIGDALRGPLWNERSPEGREHFPRLYFLENADPDTLHALLDHLDLRTTLFNVVSKSGSTVETMAQYLILEEALGRVVEADRLRAHLLFTTDASDGALRHLAQKLGVPALAVPPTVGGRYSVLSSVGLLPAAVVGVDVGDLLSGAAEMEALCRAPSLRENPAGLFATLLHVAHVERGQSIHVLMPYSDRLRTFALWLRQLWAESLGKAHDREGRLIETGPTPLAAVGAVDQHSILQLLMEGPRDKVVCLFRVREREHPMDIPRLHSELSVPARLGGHTLEALLENERRATAEALREAGRPSLSIEVERLDARSLGALFMLFEIATAYAGELYGVDPLNQPGVELGKTITNRMLAAAADWPAGPQHESDEGGGDPSG